MMIEAPYRPDLLDCCLVNSVFCLKSQENPERSILTVRPAIKWWWWIWWNRMDDVLRYYINIAKIQEVCLLTINENYNDDFTWTQYVDPQQRIGSSRGPWQSWNMYFLFGLVIVNLVCIAPFSLSHRHYHRNNEPQNWSRINTNCIFLSFGRFHNFCIFGTLTQQSWGWLRYHRILFVPFLAVPPSYNIELWFWSERTKNLGSWS